MKNLIPTDMNLMLLLDVGDSINVNCRFQVLFNEKKKSKIRANNSENQMRVRFEVYTSWLIVGCSHPVVIALMVAIASNPPAAPRQ